MSDLGISHRGSEALSGGRYRLPDPASSRGVEDCSLSIQEVRMPRPPGGRTAAQSELASASSNPPFNALPKARITEQS